MPRPRITAANGGLYGLLLICLLLVLAACSRDQISRDADSGDAIAADGHRIPGSGTSAMVTRLNEIYEDALRHPFQYYHMNSARADCLQIELDRIRGWQRLPLMYRHIRELLWAGRLEEAIGRLELLMQIGGPDASILSPASKPLFEDLAIAYLRKGELENWTELHPAGASIVPLTPDAVQTRQEDTRKAIVLYEHILGAFPDDLASRWLRSVAGMSVGEYPDGVPARFRVTLPDADASQPIPRFRNVAPALGVDVFGLAGGVSFDDFNGDNFADILATAYGLNEQVRLFVADGHGGFTDRTEAAGLNGIVSALNTVHADYDNDGDMDVLLLRGAWLGDFGLHPNSLLRNNGDGTFEDVTVSAGLAEDHPTQTAAFADFNNDGWLDLFVGNETGGGGGMGGAPIQQENHARQEHWSNLFANNGDGTFSDVARQVGIDLHHFVKGVVWGDVNNDGFADLYVSIMGQPNRLYVNRGGSSPTNWRFEDVAVDAGVTAPKYSFPVLFWDFDNDGWEDLLVASLDPGLMNAAAGMVSAEYLGHPLPGEKNHLYRNNGDGTFTDVAPESGLGLSFWTMAMNFGDINSDGFLDVLFGTGVPALQALIPNRLFLNDKGGGFVDVTYSGGFGHIQKGHGIAFADFDHDGDEDIYTVMGGAFEGDGSNNALYENPGVGGNSWVVLRLVGRTANRSAIGARVRVRVTDVNGTRRQIFRTVSTGGSFGASSLQLEIGLGSSRQIEEVEVMWPNKERTTTTYRGLLPNRYYQLSEDGTVEPLP